MTGGQRFLKKVKKLNEDRAWKVKKRIKKIERKIKKFTREREMLRNELVTLISVDDKTPMV